MAFKITRSDLIRGQNLIDGKWVDAADGARFPVTNPADGKTLIDVANSAASDARAATDAAAKALKDWRDRLPRERAEILRRWYALIVANAEDLAKIVSMEQGKPMTESRAEVAYGASYVALFADKAARVFSDLISQRERDKCMSMIKEPLGVVAAITPWNYPLAMIARKIAPALAAGCTIVAKPAEDTPLTALALATLAQEAGMPDGVLNMLSASREHGIAAVAEWLTDDRVRKISFSGATAGGKHLKRESAGSLEKLSLELGGNAHFIVFDDADLDAAVTGLMALKFHGSQTCICPNRIYVQSEKYDQFANLLSKRVGALRVAPPSDPDAQIGPMINDRAIDKIARHVDDAVRHGATVLTGGKHLTELGPNYYAPTVLTNVSDAMLLCREETFGPIAPLFRFNNEAEAMRLANDTPFELAAAYFYTQDTDRVDRVSRQLNAEVLGINWSVPTNKAPPFGDIKESGHSREGSKYGLDDYMSTKYLCHGGVDY